MISIIVPVYNSQRFIRKCIDSVLEQTYQDWELLLIDDGSLDNTLAICREYSDNCSRIHIIPKKHEGVGAARNEGIYNAKGEWICFIDADDYVETSWLEVLDKCIKKTDASLFSWGYFFEDEDGSSYRPPKIPNKGYENSTELIKSKDYKHTVWSYAFRKKYIEKYNCLFPCDVSIAEDQLFLLQYLSHNPIIHVVSLPLYHYVRHSASVTQMNYGLNRIEDYLKVATGFAHYGKNNDVSKEFSIVAITNLIYEFLYYSSRLGCRYHRTCVILFKDYYNRIYRVFPEIENVRYLKVASSFSICIADFFFHPKTFWAITYRGLFR